MLERLIDYARSADKYTIRILDEMLHRGVNHTVEYIEDKKIPRQLQAAGLSWLSSIIVLTMTNVGSLEDLFKNVDPLTKSAKASLMIAKMSSIMSVGLRDLKSITQSDSYSDGAIAVDPDVPGYNSALGTLRPYILASTIGAIIYGVIERDFDITRYSLALLPWAVSLYVRDNNSSGILDRIRENIRTWTAANPMKIPN